jgi:hypothetical protein
LVRAGLSQVDIDRASLDLEERLVTTGATSGERVVTVPDLVHDPRVGGGCAVVVDANNPLTAARPVELPAQPGGIIDVDVTPLDSTEALAIAVGVASDVDGPVLLRLTGMLAPAVLLPGFGGPELRPGAIVDTSQLQFTEAFTDPSDRSARAEFVRALASSRTAPLELHQTRAIGLAALDAAP